jgi:UDPglucose 6-dehydrogenase
MTGGNFSSQSVENAVKSIIGAINDRAKLSQNKINSFNHSIVIVSTLSPETMRRRILPLIQELNYEIRDKVEIIYSPEFIALGSVVRNLRNPEFIILGHSGFGVSNS